jgi:hypothetical protein
MTSYRLTVPSLRFAGLLATWANEYAIPYEHNVHTAKGGSRKNVKPVIRKPVVMVFDTVADRSQLMAVARHKIAAIRTARCAAPRGSGSSGKRHPVALENIAAQLERDYNAIS